MAFTSYVWSSFLYTSIIYSIQNTILASSITSDVGEKEKELQHDIAAWMVELNAHEGFPHSANDSSAGVHGVGNWKSFATEGNPPDISVTKERLYELLAQQELLRKIAGLLGAKDTPGTSARSSVCPIWPLGME